MNRVDQAMATGNDILKSIPEVPEEGQDFAYSVEEKVLGIMEWITENKRVTELQEIALENMSNGIAKWIR